MMTGNKITAEQAESLGMVYMVYSDLEFKEKSEKFALTLSSMPTKALGYTKKLLSETFNNSLDEQLSLDAKMQVKSASTEDHKIGIKAFLEKRLPEFKGK